MRYIKLFITFLLSLTIALTPVSLFAQSGSGPAEDWRKKARESRNVTISGGSVSGGNYRGNVNTRIDVGGSSSTVKTPISFPTNPATNAKSLADVAKKMAKGGAVAGGVAVAVDVILDGVDYVLDPKNNSIQKKPNPDSFDSCGTCGNLSNVWHAGTSNKDNVYFGSSEAAARHDFKKQYPNYTLRNIWISRQSEKFVYYHFDALNGDRVIQGNNSELYATRISNPQYGSDVQNIPVNDGELLDAFGEWLANNPHSITDPVVTPMYVPEHPLGQGINGFPVFPSAEMSDEILDAMIQNRDNQLWIEETGGGQLSTIGSPNESSTSKDQTGSSTETKTNPDGSTTTTTTDKSVDPDTGEITTTTTTTTTKSDGSQETSTSTKKESAAKPEITELPAVCDYFAFLCKWTDWTQQEPDLSTNTEVEIKEREFDFNVFSKDRFFVPRQCPAPIEHTFEITGRTVSFSFSLTPLCDVLEMCKPALVACSYLYAAYIVIGASRNG